MDTGDGHIKTKFVKHFTQVFFVKLIEILFNNILIASRAFLIGQKTGGWLTKSVVTFVLFEIFGWNLAIIRKYELPLSL